MKVCIVGAGAIGGYMAVRIANAGHNVSVIARGPHLAAIKDRGMKLIEENDEFVAENLTATEFVGELGPMDVVLLALKAHQIVPIVNDMSVLLGPNTVIVTLQNGIPWWYFQNFAGDYANQVVETVDPGGLLFNSIDPNRLIGCIAYPATTISKPGVIQHIEGNRFPVGELSGMKTERVQMVSDLFAESGFKSRILDDIRSEIWLKLWGNLTIGCRNDDRGADCRRTPWGSFPHTHGKAHCRCRECRQTQDLNAPGCGGWETHRNRKHARCCD